MASGRGGEAAPGERPAPKRITADYLRRAALYYLERYSVPAAQLQRVLLRKVERSCRHHGQDPQAFRTTVEEIVASCVASGLVDDRRFAEARAQSLRRKGRSARAVAAGLAAKGVGRELVAETVAVDEGVELEAARVAAKRKRLGPWSRGDRSEQRQKHIAALARAGFSLAIARAVIDDAGEGG
ncbi:regulatory protein RecX [Bosea sp. (in: a-proteobacteria)]|uniref:regulatory protein RecX n=1 Tax=Bosea sp. (in: a-proteobacteria) TaxID=1871050 RepID=UPI002DDD164E|nr:RecX family transcriptional regulator [Bosea sp. (in: a-proteobacteria)]HEV2509663.1 RecX family transcriptional regulator [Bosea sp. (in: a-proteobacteria)]